MPYTGPRIKQIIGAKVMVELDELPDKVGSIHLPSGSYPQSDAMATVLAVGTGYDTKIGRVPLEVKVGDRVAVVRQHEKTDSQKMIQAKLGERVLILPMNAILYVREEG